MIIGGIVSLSFIGIVGYFSSPNIKIDKKDKVKTKTLDIITGDFKIGSDEAPVKLVFYGDFTCPHCIRFMTTNFEKIRDDYIFKNKLQFIFRPVITMKKSLYGAKFLFCDKRDDKVNADILFNMFKNKWMLHGDYLNALLRLVKKNEWAKPEDFQQCVSSILIEQTLRNLYEETVVPLNIHETPHVFVNKMPIDYENSNAMFYIIDKQYKASFNNYPKPLPEKERLRIERELALENEEEFNNTKITEDNG